jgi:hypothetical protein
MQSFWRKREHLRHLEQALQHFLKMSQPSPRERVGEGDKCIRCRRKNPNLLLMRHGVSCGNIVEIVTKYGWVRRKMERRALEVRKAGEEVGHPSKGIREEGRNNSEEGNLQLQRRLRDTKEEGKWQGRSESAVCTSEGT